MPHCLHKVGQANGGPAPGSRHHRRSHALLDAVPERTGGGGTSSPSSTATPYAMRLIPTCRGVSGARVTCTSTSGICRFHVSTRTTALHVEAAAAGGAAALGAAEQLLGRSEPHQQGSAWTGPAVAQGLGRGESGRSGSSALCYGKGAEPHGYPVLAAPFPAPAPTTPHPTTAARDDGRRRLRRTPIVQP